MTYFGSNNQRETKELCFVSGALALSPLSPLRMLNKVFGIPQAKGDNAWAPFCFVPLYRVRYRESCTLRGARKTEQRSTRYLSKILDFGQIES